MEKFNRTHWRTAGTAVLLTILLLVSTNAYSQQQSEFVPMMLAPVACSSMDNLKKTLTEFDEDILFVGKAKLGVMNGQQPVQIPVAMMFTNSADKKSWTLVAVMKNGLACMIASGTDFQPWSGPSLLEPKEIKPKTKEELPFKLPKLKPGQMYRQANIE